MGFRSLRDCVGALRTEGECVVIDHPVDPHLEIAEIQRRLFRAGGPAVLFTHPRGTAFPVLVNLYGTHKRIERILWVEKKRSSEVIIEMAGNGRVDSLKLRSRQGKLPRLVFA